MNISEQLAQAASRLQRAGVPEARLNAENLKTWTTAARKQKVNVFLPRFKMTAEFQLNDVLATMGMPSAFDPQGADFSGMNGKTDLFISAVMTMAGSLVSLGIQSLHSLPSRSSSSLSCVLSADSQTTSLSRHELPS